MFPYSQLRCASRIVERQLLTCTGAPDVSVKEVEVNPKGGAQPLLGRFLVGPELSGTLSLVAEKLRPTRGEEFFSVRRTSLSFSIFSRSCSHRLSKRRLCSLRSGPGWKDIFNSFGDTTPHSNRSSATPRRRGAGESSRTGTSRCTFASDENPHHRLCASGAAATWVLLSSLSFLLSLPVCPGVFQRSRLQSSLSSIRVNVAKKSSVPRWRRRTSKF